MKPYHICFEGIPGAGKTTQAKILAEKLNRLEIPTKYVKNPNGDSFGKAVTNAIFLESPSKLAEIYAFAACFCQTVTEVTLPLLKNNICVVSDKGIGTAYAHALYRHEGVIEYDLFNEMIECIDRSNALHPDITILLDIPIKYGFARKSKCADKSCRDIPNSENIREAHAYRKLAHKFPNWIVVDATATILEVTDRIWFHVVNMEDMGSA